MSAGPRALLVANIVGLTPSLLGEHTPNLRRLARDGFAAPLEGVLPALTCTAQASMLTGSLPREHGIVGNGWYFRDLAEIWFWRQSNHLVGGEKVWETARSRIRGFSCAQLFWWYNMYAAVEYSLTPRPIYPADGRKIPALYSTPPSLQAELEHGLGPFPFFNFWGPAAGLESSQWIAECACAVLDRHQPVLTLVYLPHLDYAFQRMGPADPQSRRALVDIDRVAGRLIDHARGAGADVLVVSEYGIEAVHAPVHINRALRESGYLAVRETLGWELLDPGASRAFAVADHQIAHVYVNDPQDVRAVKRQLEDLGGVESVLDGPAKARFGLDHPRSGELVAVAAPGHWFTYYYWLDEARAPDFARTVDIHRKPGYDPVELFIDPAMRFPELRIGWRLLQKRLGMRMLMDVVSLDAGLVRGSHGRPAACAETGPIVIGSRADLGAERFQMTDVKSLVLRHWSGH